MKLTDVRERSYVTVGLVITVEHQADGYRVWCSPPDRCPTTFDADLTTATNTAIASSLEYMAAQIRAGAAPVFRVYGVDHIGARR